jgi:hypothetical protein
MGPGRAVEDCAKVVEFLATDLSDYVTRHMNAFPALEDQMCEFDPVYFDSSYYLYPDAPRCRPNSGRRPSRK